MLLLPTLFLLTPARAQTGLQVTYGGKGIETLAYGGVALEDVRAYPSDSFHIWHMKSTDLNGNVVSSGQYGWGETNNGTSWNAQTNTETYTFSWGSIATQFVQNGNNLDMVVTEVNNANSGIIFDGAEIYPMALHFPNDPVGFNGYTQYAITTTGPAVMPADFGVGVVTSVIPNESVALYGGWKTAGANTYTPIMTGTAPDGLATFLPSNDQPVQPGSSFTYTVSLRFTPEGTAASASDAYSSFAATYPSQLNWPDRRIIGTAYLASSPASNGNITQPGGFPTNPRRYFNDSTVDITTSFGLKVFQDRMLAQADTNVVNALAMNAQAVMTWDIEGEQYPQNTSYVCSPDLIASVAPEMESIISDPLSPYFGKKLDDAYFHIMTSAGLKVGVCLRPQVFTFGPNNTASQVYLSTNSAVIENLESKAKYANSRWGTTLFYVDSSVNVNGGALDPAIFQQLITDLPGFLFIPEESTPRYYAYSAPFYSFIFQTNVGTPASIYNVYPTAFGANLVNDVAPATLAQYQSQLTRSVSSGDILMGIADFWQANDPTLISIYQAAGRTSPPPAQQTPTIIWNAPQAMTYGTPLSGIQLNAVANVPGTFVYSPAAGSVLAAGKDTLLVTFNPADPALYKSVTASVSLTVNKATPVITWRQPASIPYGTALGAAQLDATANVSGTFTYKPAAGVKPSLGTNTLTVSFTPTDSTDYRATTAKTLVVVVPATPSITWNTPAAITAGTPLSAAQLNATSSVPGTFFYTPGAGAILPVGTDTLFVSFRPTDTKDYTVQTATVQLLVNAVSPPNVNIAILTPGAGATVSGQILVTGLVNLFLDSAGTFLMVDGAEVGTRRVLGAPWSYPLDTTTLTNGSHTLQLWGHDIGNNTSISAPVVIKVKN